MLSTLIHSISIRYANSFPFSTDVRLQYFLRTLDDHAEQYLKIFTLLPLDRIGEIMLEHQKAPEKRLAQRTLAAEIVTLIHRNRVTETCIFQTAALYPARSKTADDEENQSPFNTSLILGAFRGDDTILKRLSLDSITGVPLARLLKSVGLVNSFSSIPSNMTRMIANSEQTRVTGL